MDDFLGSDPPQTDGYQKPESPGGSTTPNPSESKLGAKVAYPSPGSEEAGHSSKVGRELHPPLNKSRSGNGSKTHFPSFLV